MRMYAQSDIGYRCRHFNGEYTLGDQFPRASSHNPHTQHALRFRVYDELCHTIIAVESSCPARCAPGKTGNLNRTVLLLRLGLGQTAQAISGSVKTTAGIARGSKTTSRPAITSAATRPSCVAL